MFLFGGVRRFRRMGPLGLAFMGYRLWRRLSAQQKSAIRESAGSAVSKLRRSAPSRQHTVEPTVTLPPPGQDDTAARTVAATASAATAPTEEIAPTDNTGVTIEEQRLEQEAERAAGASTLSDLPPADN